MNDLHDEVTMIADIKISVVVPAYNREKTIKRCIDSILSQTVLPFEIIVVDDGSTDKTIDILENISNGLLRIIKQNHKGAQAARNLGIMNAEGNYIAFLDSDDEWMPQMLETELAYFSKVKEDCVIYSDCFECQNNKKRLRKLPECNSGEDVSPLMRGGAMFQSMLAKKELFYKIGLLDEKVVAYQEWDTAIRLAREAKFVHVRKPLFIYHLHEEETISKDKDKSIRGYAYIIDKYQKETIKRNDIKVLNIYYKYLISKCYKCRDRCMLIYGFRIFYINILYWIKLLLKSRI